LVISARALTVVPGLQGDYQSTADAITRAGLVPGSPQYRWGGSPGQVVSLVPAPGTRVDYGTVVEVVVGSGSRMTMGVDFEDNLFLSSVDIDRVTVSAGETLRFEPRWEAVGPVSGEYAARAVLQGADGVVISQDENAPIGADGRPTTAWAPGEVVGGLPFDLPIPEATASGDYALWIDLYRVGSPDARLAVRGAGAAEVRDNQVRVIAIEVESGGP